MAVVITNRHIGISIVAVFMSLAVASSFGFGVYPAEVAREFLLLAGGLLTSETVRLGYRTAKGDGSLLNPEGNSNTGNQTANESTDQAGSSDKN